MLGFTTDMSNDLGEGRRRTFSVALVRCLPAGRHIHFPAEMCGILDGQTSAHEIPDARNRGELDIYTVLHIVCVTRYVAHGFL